jgi:hypothetical protein
LPEKNLFIIVTFKFLFPQILAARNRNAFPITETELNDIAAAAIMGLSNIPVSGYSTPAATGTPRAL